MFYARVLKIIQPDDNVVTFYNASLSTFGFLSDNYPIHRQEKIWKLRNELYKDYFEKKPVKIEVNITYTHKQ